LIVDMQGHRQTCEARQRMIWACQAISAKQRVT
jgi:hypothetical protein